MLINRDKESLSNLRQLNRGSENKLNDWVGNELICLKLFKQRHFQCHNFQLLNQCAKDLDTYICMYM